MLREVIAGVSDQKRCCSEGFLMVWDYGKCRVCVYTRVRMHGMCVRVRVCVCGRARAR